MVRLVIAGLLLLAVISNALWVVFMTHESREQFLELERLAAIRDETNAEWTRLRLEQATLADASRIEQLARQQLNMKTPESINILDAK